MLNNKYYALINNGLVESIIVADDKFLIHIENKYDFIVDVTEKRPNTGDSYYPDKNLFVSNTDDAPNIYVDLTSAHLQNGTDSGFSPFKLSIYAVSYHDGFVKIGCKKYSAVGLFDTLHKLLNEKQSTVHCFTTLEEGPAHGKFGITWADSQKLYDVLSKVKLI